MQNMQSNNNDLLDCRSLCGCSFESVHSEINSSQVLLLPRILEIYTGSILVRPGIEEGRENIFISLHRTPVLNSRNDCGCPSSERIRYNEGHREEV